MGMYDDLECHYELPHPHMQEATFQTKSLDRLLDHYTITTDGRLLVRASPWWREENEVPPGPVVDEEYPYTGEIVFYDFQDVPYDETHVDHAWYEYVALFRQGKLLPPIEVVDYHVQRCMVKVHTFGQGEQSFSSVGIALEEPREVLVPSRLSRPRRHIKRETDRPFRLPRLLEELSGQIGTETQKRVEELLDKNVDGFLQQSERLELRRLLRTIEQAAKRQAETLGWSLHIHKRLEHPPPTMTEAELVEELKRRIDDLESGQGKTIPADIVFLKLEERLMERYRRHVGAGMKIMQGAARLWNRCYECGRFAEPGKEDEHYYVIVGAKPDFDTPTTQLCLPCVQKLFRKLERRFGKKWLEKACPAGITQEEKLERIREERARREAEEAGK